MYDVDIDTSDPSKLSINELGLAIQRDMLSESQLIELGLDTPAKVQAVLRGDDPSAHIDPASMPASGNHMTLTPDEVALIEHRRQQALKEPTPTIKVAKAEDDEDEEDLDYASMTNDDLRAELSRRELPVDGVKADLIARLEEDDAVNDE